MRYSIDSVDSPRCIGLVDVFGDAIHDEFMDAPAEVWLKDSDERMASDMIQDWVMDEEQWEAFDASDLAARQDKLRAEYARLSVGRNS